jgi:hypothetical protein
VKLEGKSELFRMLAPPGECPECGDAARCECPMSDSYRQIDGTEATTCQGCDGTGGPGKNCAGCGGTGVRTDPCWRCNDMGYMKDWSGKKCPCYCSYPDNGPD